MFTPALPSHTANNDLGAWMIMIMQSNVVWKTQKSPHCFLHLIHHPSVPTRFGPHRKNILTIPARYHCTSYFPIGNTNKLSTKQCKDNFLPITCSQQPLLWKTDCPFTTSRVGRILPSWLDPLTKEMIIGSGRQGIRSDNVIVNRPEFFNGTSCAYGLDGIGPIVIFAFVVSPLGAAHVIK